MTDILSVYFGLKPVGPENVIVCYVFNRSIAQHYNFITGEIRTKLMNALKNRYREGGLDFSDRPPEEFMTHREMIKDLDTKVLDALRKEIKGIHL